MVKFRKQIIDRYYRPRVEWFGNLVGDAVRCRTYPAIEPKGIVEKCLWSGRQWPTTVGILLEAAGGDLSWLSWLGRKGEGKLKSKERIGGLFKRLKNLED